VAKPFGVEKKCEPNANGGEKSVDTSDEREREIFNEAIAEHAGPPLEIRGGEEKNSTTLKQVSRRLDGTLSNSLAA
jgi:hypothetical protein